MKKSQLEQYRTHMHDGHQPLAQMLPLDTPLSVNIDPSSYCNFNCIFCPTGTGKAGRGRLSKHVINAIDQLKGFPHRVKSLWLMKDGEPLAHPHICKMITYAAREGVADEIKLTTNGSLLTEDLCRQLIDSGLDYIKFSIYGMGDMEYTVKTGFPVYQIVWRAVRKFYELRGTGRKPHIHCKILDINLTEEQVAKFCETFGPISDSINVDSLMGWGTGDWSGKEHFLIGEKPTTGMDGVTPLTEKMVCAEPFKSMAVNADGSVTTCCVDWSGGNIYGDVYTPLPELWNGRHLQYIRMTHLEGDRRALRACWGCHYLKGLPATQNLDEDAERLRKIYD